MNHRWISLVGGLIAAALAAGCGSDSGAPGASQLTTTAEAPAITGQRDSDITPSTSASDTTRTDPSTTTTAESRAVPRPPLIVQGSNEDLVLNPYTYCWTTQRPDGLSETECGDGVWPDPLPSAGQFDAPIRFEFPLAGWTFAATMGPPDGQSGGQTPARLLEPGIWEIELAGPTGTSIVQLSGSGPEGDYHVVFEAELLIEGVEPPPVVDFTGPYGDVHPNDSLARLMLSINQLADDRNPSATVTVTNSSGARIEIVLGDHQDGPDPEGNGSVVLQSPEPDPELVSTFGPPPYVYDIELTIADATHHAQVTFPDDLNSKTASFDPSFQPPLPSR